MKTYLQISRARDLDLYLGLGQTANSRASLIDLYLHAASLKLKKETSRGRTDVRTDGQTFEIHFIRLTQKSHLRKVTASHTHYRALGPELIQGSQPAGDYKSSTRR